LTTDRDSRVGGSPSQPRVPGASRRSLPIPRDHNALPRWDLRPDHSGDELDWSRLLRTLWRRKLLLAVIVVLAISLASLYVSQVPAEYEAHVLVMLNDRATASDFRYRLDGSSLGEEYIESELHVIETRAMAEKLSKSFSLHTLPEFNPDLRSDSLVDIWINGLVPEIMARIRIDDPSPPADQDWSQARYLKTINEVLDHIRAEQVGTNLIQLSFSSSNPSLAEQGTRKLVTLYMEERLLSRLNVAAQEAEFLRQQITRYRTKVAVQTQRIQEHRKRHQLDREDSLVEEIADLSARRLDLQSALKATQSRRGTNGVPLAPTSELLSDLLARLIDTEKEIDTLKDEYGANHPTMRDLEAQRASIQWQINQEMHRLLARQRDEILALREQIASLEQAIEVRTKRLDQIADARGELEALEREVAPDQRLLEQYLERLNEVEALKKVKSTDVRIVSDAVAPDEPKYPRTYLILGVVFFGSLIGGGLLVLGIESLDDTVRSLDHIEDIVALPTLVLVPKIKGNPEDYVLEYPHSPFGEAVRSFRTALFLTGNWTPPKIFLLASAISGEGKTSLAMCLARVDAVAGRRTLLIDCDLRRPRVHQLTRKEVGEGLSDILLRKRRVDDVIQTDHRSGAHFITAGGRVDDPAALLGSPPMRELLNEVAAKYDLVVLDSPPLLSVSDGRILSRLVDKTVFVVHWGKTKRNDVILGARVLFEAEADVAGVALSQVDVRKHARYNFRDSGHYYDRRYTGYYTHRLDGPSTRIPRIGCM
jgi:succinoglycan biosynthesis transport protein ExoP